MTQIVKLVERSQDARHWTPEDALIQTLERIRNGEIDPKYLAIHWTVEKGDLLVHQYAWAGGSLEQHVALMAVANQKLADHWR